MHPPWFLQFLRAPEGFLAPEDLFWRYTTPQSARFPTTQPLPTFWPWKFWQVKLREPPWGTAIVRGPVPPLPPLLPPLVPAPDATPPPPTEAAPGASGIPVL